MEPALPPDEEIAALRAQLARRDEVIAARDAVIAAQAAALGERDIRLAAARLQIEQLQAQRNRRLSDTVDDYAAAAGVDRASVMFHGSSSPRRLAG
jgi:hypothetical protein